MRLSDQISRRVRLFFPLEFSRKTSIFLGVLMGLGLLMGLDQGFEIIESTE